MDDKTILDTIKTGDLARLPSASPLSDPLKQMLWPLWAVKEVSLNIGLSPSQISGILRDISGVNIHWRTIETNLSNRPDLVFKNLKYGTHYYKIMSAGENLLFGTGDVIYFVDPATAYSATTRLHDLLGKSSGTVRICDPYADRTSLEHLTAIPSTCRILWLTTKVSKDRGFRLELAAFAKQFAPIEVRILPKALHDRYIIDDTSMFILGTSLNSFGKSQSFVIAAGRQIRAAIVNVFNSNWASAQPLS